MSTTYEDTLVYRVTVPDDDLDAITAKVAKAAAAGMAAGTGIGGGASPGAPGGGTVRGGFGGTGQAIAQGASFASSVSIFASAVNKFAASGGGGGSGGAGGGAKRPPKLPAAQNYFSALFGKGNRITPLGQMFGMGRGGIISNYVRGLGMQPGGGWLGKMTGTALQAGGASGGISSRLLMGGAGAMMGGMAGGMGGAMAGGLAGAIGGPAGLAVTAAISAIKLFTNAMDGMVQSLGKYNGEVQAAAAMFNVQSMLLTMKLGNMFQGTMTAWIELKSSFLDLISELMDAIGPIIDILARGVLFVLKLVVEAFKWLLKPMELFTLAVLYVSKAMMWLANKLFIMSNAEYESANKQLDEFIAKLKKSGDTLDDTAKKMAWNLDHFGANAKKFPGAGGVMGAGLGGARGANQGNPNVPPIQFHRPDPLPLPKFGGGGAMPFGMAAAGILGQIAFSQLPNWNTPGHGYMQPRQGRSSWGKIPGVDFLKSWSENLPWAIQHQAAVDKVAGFQSSTNVSGVIADMSSGVTGGASMMSAKNPPNQNLPATSWDSIKQNVQLQLQMNVTNTQAVNEAILQVRDKLLRGLAVSRDETRLLFSIFDAGLSSGM